jgi:DNA-binding MarR family transcriptional regulator
MRNRQRIGPLYGFAMGMEAWASTDDEDPVLPGNRWPNTPRKMPIYAALHGAFHLMNRRLDFAARDSAGLSATDAIVLYSALTNPDQGVFALRAATGLRASTLNSVLNRLDGKRLLKRVHETSDRRYAEVRLTVEGRAYAELSRDALHELDEELAIFLSADQRVRERNLRGGPRRFHGLAISPTTDVRATAARGHASRPPQTARRGPSRTRAGRHE